MSLQEKIDRVRKFGLSEGEYLNPEEEVPVLMAHIEFLDTKNQMLYSALEDIATGYAPDEKVREYAQYILEQSNVRAWRDTKF